MRSRQRLLVALGLKHLERRELLAEQTAGLGLQGGQRYTRLNAADNVGPLDFGIVQVRRANDRVH